MEPVDTVEKLAAMLRHEIRSAVVTMIAADICKTFPLQHPEHAAAGAWRIYEAVRESEAASRWVTGPDGAAMADVTDAQQAADAHAARVVLAALDTPRGQAALHGAGDERSWNGDDMPYYEYCLRRFLERLGGT